MTIARLAQKLHAYAAYHEYAPQAQTVRGTRGSRRQAAMSAWRYRYPVFPRLLTGASEERLACRIADLRSLAASDPELASIPLWVGVITLEQLRNHGPFEPVFTPILGPAEPVDAWIRSSVAAAA
ncbi:hypothetical protein ACFXPJ_37345 [Streptomyces goshikiensis]